jgi:Tol biopolymer transport system component
MHDSGNGSIFKVCLLAAAVVLLAATTWRVVTERSDRSPTRQVEATKRGPAPAAGGSTTHSLAKVENVFFLPEADPGYASTARPSSRRLPAANGTRRLGPPRAVTSKSEGEFIAPRWSPDGLELLFSKPGYNGLYVKGAEGGALRELTDTPHVGYKSNWNADGSISAVANDANAQQLAADGTPLGPPSPMDDASYVGAFTQDDKVYYRGAAGEPARLVSDGDDRFYGGVVSPDGRYIVYNGLYTGLYIAPINGSGAPVYLGDGHSPSWLPDGSGIVYNISIDDGHQLLASDLYLTSTDGTSISNLTQTSDQIELNPSVSPDGRWVAYEVDGVIYMAPLY